MAEGQRTNEPVVRTTAAKQGLETLKQQVAAELGINTQGYLGDIPARQAGAIGGHMVRRMIQLAEQQIAGGAGVPAGTVPGGAGFPGTAPGTAGFRR